MSESSLNGVSILIEYREACGNDKWHRLTLRPEEYFDLDDGESPAVGSVPRHDHAIEYLSVDPEAVSATKAVVSDGMNSRTILESYWHQGQNRIIERRDRTPTTEYWELILEIRLSDIPPKWRVLRFTRADDVPSVVFDVLVERNVRGEEVETSLF